MKETDIFLSKKDLQDIINSESKERIININIYHGLTHIGTERLKINVRRSD